MMKKTIALVLVLLMASAMIAGCGKKDSGSASGGSGAEAKEWTWPLEEQKTLTAWVEWSNDYVEHINDLKGIQKIEENTNVHVEWTEVDSATASEQFGLMLASGKYPDIIRNVAAYYPGGTEKGVADGVLADLTDVIEGYMPNYMALVNSDPQLQKDVKTDDGRFVGPWTIASYFGDVRGERVWAGPVVRKDWLEESGATDVPRTIADWENFLVFVKENHPECEAPLMIGSNGADFFSSFLSAYGVLRDWYVEGGKTIKYGPMEEGYKEWLTLMHDWYTRGLVDPNFMTNGADILCPADYIGTGKAASGMELWGLTDTILKQQGYNNEDDFCLVATSAPVMNEGDTPQIGFNTSALVKEQLGISAKTADLELTCRYLDYWYTDEAMLLDSLGIEGETYTVEGDTYHLTPAMQQMVDEGKVNTLSEAVYTYTLGTSDFALYNWGMFDPIYEGNPAMDAYEEFDKAKFDLMVPACMTMTDEENTEYVALYTDIETLMQENTVKFITGEKDLAEWDSYVEQLHTYNIDRCIELKQAALDRYNAR